MTVNQLQKALTVMILNGHKNKRVCVDKETFTHPLEADGCCIIDIDSIQLKSVPMIDDDGGVKELADGSESYHKMIVISGSV